MPRRPRLATGRLAHHVLDRRIGRLPLFEKPGDYLAFEKIFLAIRQLKKMKRYYAGSIVDAIETQLSNEPEKTYGSIKRLRGRQEAIFRLRAEHLGSVISNECEKSSLSFPLRIRRGAIRKTLQERKLQENVKSRGYSIDLRTTDKHTEKSET